MRINVVETFLGPWRYSRVRYTGIVGMSTHFSELCKVLFEGPVKARDIKTLRGTDESVGREEISREMLASMRRMGVVRNNELVDINGVLPERS